MSHPKLHVYSPSYFHDHAFIVGNKAALEDLRKAIEDALAGAASSPSNQGVGMATAATADGEGFEMMVYCEEQDSYWDKARLPYTDKDLCDDAEAIGPWDLFKKYKQ